MKEIQDIITEIYDRPNVDELTSMKEDTECVYVNATYCVGLGNLLDHQSTFMIARYSLDPWAESNNTIILDDSDKHLKTYYDNIEYLNTISDKEWYHTKYGDFCEDDVIITGECDKNYYIVWLDQDVSDCCITKISKEHYQSLEEFNEAVVKYFNHMGYKINPIREPRGWFKW